MVYFIYDNSAYSSLLYCLSTYVNKHSFCHGTYSKAYQLLNVLIENEDQCICINSNLNCYKFKI